MVFGDDALGILELGSRDYRLLGGQAGGSPSGSGGNYRPREPLQKSALSQL